MISAAFMSIAQQLNTKLNDQQIVDVHGKTQYIGLFADQFNNEDEEHITPKPAIAIQFLNLPWSSESQGSQKSKAIVRIHIAYHSIADMNLLDPNINDAIKFDLFLDEVHNALQGFSATGLGAMDRTQSIMDVKQGHVIVTNMDYTCTINDDSANITNEMIEVTPDYEVIAEKVVIPPVNTPWTNKLKVN